MKTKPFCWFNILFAALLMAVFALGGCGDDGSAGAPGPEGPAGADATFDAETLVELGLQDSVVALNPVLDLSNTVEYDATTGVLTAHFTLTDGTAANNVVDAFSDAYEFRFYVAELIDNEDGTIGQSWNQLFSERGTPAAEDPDDHLPGTLTQDPDTGKYTYVFADTVAASDNVFRVTARARWRECVDVDKSGGRCDARRTDDIYVVFANPVNDNYDFLQSDPGNELTSSGADMVTTEACESCHGARIGNVGHGGGYTKVKTCNNCHNVNYMATVNDGAGNDGEGDLAFMIHRIHNAGVFDRLGEDPDRGIPPEDFSHVTYPQHIYTCSKCHTDDAPNANLSELVPTSMNCGSCHSDVNFVTGDNHAAGPQTDANCSLCHKAGFAIGGVSLDPAVVHNPDPEPANVPEYDVTIGMTPPVNGEYYAAGETPWVRVNLAVDGVPVPGSVYTADADGEGAAGNLGPGLSTANLFVYGPRSNAVPVLTSNSTTDPAWDPLTRPTQGHSLLLTGGVSTDPQVRTNANGYQYQLMDNFSDLAPGTYMVRFEGEDYGAISDADYRTASSAVITFQVGTATEEPKVSGDACKNCHGDTIMHLEGAHPHHQSFDTDGCLGCHDLSENYGNYIGNRVHAVHSASATGDLHPQSFGGPPRNWSHVTFPRPANNCRTCHTNSAADVPVWRDPNEVACGGCHGTVSDPNPADFPDVPAEQLAKEAAAATHMVEMGGSFDFNARTTNPYDPRYIARQCIVCHGEDRIADTFVTHGLVNFPVDDTASDE
jgi:hypothetical protein